MTNTLSLIQTRDSTLEIPFSVAETLEITAVDPLGPFTPVYLIDEGFEGTGAPSGWGVYSGVPDWDYTAVPLVGLKSLRLPSSSGASYTGLNNTELWFKFSIKFEELSAGSYFFQPSTGTMWSYLVLNLDGTIRVTDNAESVSDTTVNPITAGTVYDFFVHLKTGTGVNAIVEFAFAPAGSPRPNSGNSHAIITTGDTVGSYVDFQLFSSGSHATVWDSFQVADTDLFETEPFPATGYSIDGPSGGVVDVESDDFTVELTPSGGEVTGSVTITPDDGSDGTFTPASVELTTASPSAVFTYTPVSIGAKTISTTNDGELDDPGSLTYTVAASGLSDGDPVTTWQDSSGNGNDAAMTGSNRPTFKTAIVNGKPVVRFTSAGSSKMNLTTPITGDSPWTVFAVMKLANPASSDLFGLASSSVLPIGLWQNGTDTTIGLGAEDFKTAVNSQESAFAVFTATTPSTVLYTNGTSQALSFIGTVVPGDFENLGWRANVPEHYGDGDIAEVIIYNVDLSGTNRANVEKYLGTKYAITVAGGSAVQPDTVSGLQGWWKADSLG